MISEVIPSALEGERIDRVVAMLTGCSRAEAASALQAAMVAIDGTVVTKPSTRVLADQTVTVAGDPVRPPETVKADPSVPVNVLYEDDHVIVINKPAGLVVHPGPGHRGATLVHGLLARYPEIVDVGGDPIRPGIVHRLDKGTSGLLVVARTELAYEHLVGLLSAHDVDRHYQALVWGHFDTPLGTIDAPIGRSRRDPLKMTVAATGRPSRTHYQVLETFRDPVPLTLVELQLETGRTHQIRVHLRSIGHTVVGDDLYGGVRPTLALARPFLHAFRLGFQHPDTGEDVEFNSPLADDLVAMLDSLS